MTIGTDPFTGAQLLPNITGIRYGVSCHMITQYLNLRGCLPVQFIADQCGVYVLRVLVLLLACVKLGGRTPAAPV